MIPTSQELASDKLVHKFGSMFNPPGITNFLGVAQVDLDITGIRSINFPPFTNSDNLTAVLYVDDRIFLSLGREISFQWFPDRIERESEYNGIKYKSILVIPFGTKSAVMELQVKNLSSDERNIKLRFGLAANITQNKDCGQNFLPPSEADNEINIDYKRNSLIFKAMHSKAFCVQGIYPRTEIMNEFGASTSLTLNPNESKSVYVVCTVGENETSVINEYDKIVSNIKTIIPKVREDWDCEIIEIFTPNNSTYSGNMPTLVTNDEDIKRLYYTSIIGTVYFRRDNPYSVYGRAYDTLMPKYWQTTTFIWDYHLASLQHALLDPEVLRKYIELWMKTDIHTHFGTEYLSGKTVGPWYAVNDFAMSWLSNDYLRWNGDFNWIEKKINGKSNKKIIDYLLQYASNWEGFKTASGLADYGGINNLLECVSTYIHEVASLNAGNIFNLRFAADLLKHSGNKSDAEKLLKDAVSLLKKLQKLYADGKGYWCARFPNGKLVEVRHCYDFFTILNTIGNDLSQKQKDEMVDFFERELQTPKWMRALSPADENAMFSVRPDHQWNGAYTAWPALAASGLYNIGRADKAFNWMKGVAKSINQGPFGQGHFTEEAFKTDSGGARKPLPKWPYATDWLCSSNASYTNVIIEGIFGVKATLFDGIKTEPQFDKFDSKAELINLKYRGKQYNVNKSGLKS